MFVRIVHVTPENLYIDSSNSSCHPLTASVTIHHACHVPQTKKCGIIAASFFASDLF